MTDLGTFQVPSTHPCLPGHFPGRPVVPGVILLDHAFALIQAAHPGHHVTALPAMKFLAPVLPDQQVTVAASALQNGRLPFACRVDGVDIARGTAVLTA